MLASVDCCDPNGLDAMFSGQLVRRELDSWRRGGLNGRQRSIVDSLEPFMPGTTVLDIGCGIGAVGATLLSKGASRGTFVDVSAAYLRAAREVAAQAGVEERASFQQDDFATSKHPYPQTDVVVLDRVVCCYPDATALLSEAARHSKRTLVYTHPRPLWFMPLFRAFCALGMRLFGREYRFFLHDPELLLRAATGVGHARVVTRSVRMWQLVKVSRG
jgi:2-polyprenyl-3-methyl-5-hydroxy-6-metoxy-1,4-benzoquinol methylase